MRQSCRRHLPPDISYKGNDFLYTRQYNVSFFQYAG